MGALKNSWRSSAHPESDGRSYPGSRAQISGSHRASTIKINPEKIKDVIGKGGSVIRALTEEIGTNIRAG